MRLYSAHQTILSIFAVLSAIGNSLLITLILHNKSRVLGHYRWLLLAFAVVDITISIYHAIVVPTYFQIEYGCLAFTWAAISQPAPFGFVINSIYCILFYEPFILLMFHFIYRLLMLVNPSTIYYHALRFAMLAIVTNLILSSMVVGSSFILGLNEQEDFFGPDLLAGYGINTATQPTPNLILMNFVHSPSRGGGINWITIAGISNSGIVVSISFAAIGYCTVRIRRVFKTSPNMSEKTSKLHYHLFRALLVQFLVPFILCVLPYITIILMPLTGRRFGKIGNILANLVSIFPALDAFLVMCLVGRFRSIIKSWLSKICRPRHANSTRVFSLS